MMASSKKNVTLNSPDKESRKSFVVPPAKNIDNIRVKQKQIVDGASKIFFEKGFHPTTIRMIASASGMSMGQLYHYVTSKDDVLYLVHENVYNGLRDLLINSGVEKLDDPLERFIAALKHTLKYIAENRKLVQFAYSESKYLRKKHLEVVLGMYLKNQVGYWRQLLVDVSKKKPIKVDLDFAARFIAYQTAFLALSGWTLKEKPLDESINLVIDFVLKGLGFSTKYLAKMNETFDSEERNEKKPAARVRLRRHPKP